MGSNPTPSATGFRWPPVVPTGCQARALAFSPRREYSLSVQPFHPAFPQAFGSVRFVSVLRVLAGAYLGFAVCAYPAARPPDPAAALLLEQARRIRQAGDLEGTVMVVREGFLAGSDTLRGAFTWRADERTLALGGPGTRFEWWSRADGREQWFRSGEGGRPRRLPPHAWRRPAFSPDISFEDLARLPSGYTEEARVARTQRVDDTTAVLELVPPQGLGLFYAALDATFSGSPALLRRIVFRGHPGRPSRTLEIVRYAALPDGLMPVELEFTSGDGLTRTRLVFSPSLSGSAGSARDHAIVHPPEAPVFAVPRWETRGARDTQAP